MIIFIPDSPEDERTLFKADNYHSALFDFNQRLRARIKYELQEKTQTTRMAEAEEIQKVWIEVLKDNEVQDDI